jgi:hypothetical protein
MEIKEGGNRFREELYTCALKASFSEAAFIGDISIFRNISCWASALHQVRPEGDEKWG